MRSIVFIVHHWRDDLNGEDAKMIGLFDSEASVDKALELLKLQPGFLKFPDSFRITRFILDQTHWTDGYEGQSNFPASLTDDELTADDLPIALSKLSEVYCLTHFYETEKEDEEEVRYIGVYSTIDNVKAAIDLLKTKPGFESHPNDYNYDKFELNKTEWNEGFISWDEALDI